MNKIENTQIYLYECSALIFKAKNVVQKKVSKNIARSWMRIKVIKRLSVKAKNPWRFGQAASRGIEFRSASSPNSVREWVSRTEFQYGVCRPATVLSARRVVRDCEERGDYQGQPAGRPAGAAGVTSLHAGGPYAIDSLSLTDRLNPNRLSN